MTATRSTSNWLSTSPPSSSWSTATRTCDSSPPAASPMCSASSLLMPRTATQTTSRSVNTRKQVITQSVSLGWVAVLEKGHLQDIFVSRRNAGSVEMTTVIKTEAMLAKNSVGRGGEDHHEKRTPRKGLLTEQITRNNSNNKNACQKKRIADIANHNKCCQNFHCNKNSFLSGHIFIPDDTVAGTGRSRQPVLQTLLLLVGGKTS